MLKYRKHINRFLEAEYAIGNIYLPYFIFLNRYRKKVEHLRSQSKTTMNTTEIKKANMEHLKSFGVSREPLLTGIASEYDISLFRKAQVHNGNCRIQVHYTGGR